ncbi:hypothetical protein CPBP_01141 [Candidatus Bodocaedibacter vickermanii]|uniref:Uncharacterized protein n=1 Tax=Candidatus Bodocaedibacter vickermanii TaxID=2741701 RepID=A0A7L9RV11_9PROT|nr:hypothetical protein CPBP_01141 [Candidatus Paracaedibacteraceae bacterium 'Lake Konstanz']
MILRYFVEECVLVPCCCLKALCVRFSKLSYIKSVSDHIGSKQRDVASISVMRFVKLQSVSDQMFKTERIPSNPHVQKEPHFLHEWGKADFIDRLKSVFYEPVGSRGCLQGCIY